MELIRSRTAVVAVVVMAVAALTIALATWQSWPAQAQDIWIVNDDTGETVGGCGSPDFLTSDIEDAIDSPAVSDGDTLVICEGTYVGDITVDKSLSISGYEGAARGDVKIDIDPASPTDGLAVSADNVRIRHLTVDGPGASNVGILVLTAGPPGYKQVTISDVELTGWDEGMRTNNAVDMAIEGGHVHHNRDGVVMVAGVRNGLQGTDITENSQTGLVVIAEDELVVEGNTLSGNMSQQMLVSGPRFNVRIVRNDIVTAPDSTGISIASGSAEAFIQIGGSPENANSFTGPLDPPNYAYLVHDCYAENTVDATYNWWGTVHRPDIANRILNDEDEDTGSECALPHEGSVVFHPWATGPAPTPSPSPTPAPSPSPSPTPSTRDFDLQLGWNNFVWTGLPGTDPATALSCIDGNYVIAYRFVALNQTFQRHVPGDEALSNMTNLDKYDSLLVLVTASGVQCLGMPVEP